MTHFATQESILVPEERMRKEFDEEAHEELYKSIAARGLLHPIICRKTPGGQLQLVAGERRLRAMRALILMEVSFRCGGEAVPEGCVPFSYTDEISDLEAKEIELDENIKRRDLTPIERAAARKALFDFRQAQAEAKGEKYTVADFQEELARAGVKSVASQRTIMEEFRVAENLHNPEVKNATTLKDAVKATKKATEKLLLDALSEIVSQEEGSPHELIVGDCLDSVRSLPSGRFDCVCTDPPYGIGIDDSGSMVENRHHYADGPEVLERILASLPEELFRITRAQAHLYWFCDLRWFTRICDSLESAGWSPCKFPIIWWKQGKAMAPDITRWPKRTYEVIVYAIKGDKPPLKVAGDVIATSYGSDLQQAEKPKELYVELLSRSCLEGSQVIDPFCGSGVIFTAAEELKCYATGIELDAERAKLANLRAHGQDMKEKE